MSFKSSGSSDTINQLGERFETDRYGVDTCVLSLEIPDDLFPGQLLADFAPHPRFSSMALTRRSGTRGKPGWWRVDYSFEGFLFSLPEPTYELTTSLTQEPIQTHEDFSTTIGGTPAAPLNGAIFVDYDSGFRSEKADAIFLEFGTGGTPNKAGIDSYLAPGAEWRETKFQTTRPTGIRDVGTIDTPSGSPPSVAGRDWLAWSESYVRRGYIYQVVTVWKLSGRNGWDTDIYS